MYRTLVPLLALLSPSLSAKTDLPPVIASFGNVRNNLVAVEEDPTFKSLDCDAKGDPQPEITWFKNGEAIQEGEEGLLLDPSIGRLEFVNPTSTDFGSYHCEASNGVGKAVSQIVEVTDFTFSPPEQYERPTFLEQPSVQIKEVGQPAEFQCRAEGVPKPDLIWTKDGEEIEGNRGRESLRIDAIDPSDVGTYACNATNPYGYVYKVVYLNILQQTPYLLERPRNKTRAVKQDVVLRCSAKGYPQPTTEWRFQGQTMEGTSIDFELGENGDLILKKINVDNAGEYTCVASNANGVYESSAFLTVVQDTTITEKPKDVDVRVRQTYTLPCTVVYDPTADVNLRVIWKKDNVDIEQDSRRTINHKDEDHSLTIKKIAFEDQGDYTCVAMTNTGSVTETATLTVLGLKPNITTGPTEGVHLEGKDIELLCEADGVPEPELLWFRDTSRVRHADDKFDIGTDGRLIIKNAQRNDSAKYICAAENKEGKATASAFVDIRRGLDWVTQPESVPYIEGATESFLCALSTDEKLQDSLQIEWFKDNELIVVENGTENGHFFIDENNTLFVTNVTSEDVGEYRCVARSPVDMKQASATLGTPVILASSQWWLILLIVLIIILIVLLCCVFLCCLRKRNKKSGHYSVKDVEDGKSSANNRTDISYEINGDAGSLNKAEFDLLNSDSKTPIFTPRTLKNLNEYTKGSENSLLNLTEDELLLTKGFDEDGSFRGRYAE